MNWFPTYAQMRTRPNNNRLHSAFIGCFVTFFNMPWLVWWVLVIPIMTAIVRFVICLFNLFCVFPIQGLMGGMDAVDPNEVEK